MAPPLQSLPFDVILQVAMYLPLKYTLCLASTCCVAHDAVYYCFAHWKVLDFASCLNNLGTIDLSDEEILAVLHAHTRAVCIRHLALQHTFKRFNELKTYFSMYLGLGFDGHPTGQLSSVHLPDELKDNPATRTTYLTVEQTIGAHDEWGLVTENHGYSIDEMEWSSIYRL